MFYRFTRFWLKTYFCMFYRFKVYGVENLPVGPAIIAPNHTSFYDPPIIAISCKEEVFFLARATLFDHFLFGSLIRNLNAYPVAGTAQDLGSLKLICQLLKESKKVVIFPEGIRSDDGSLSPIKSGIGMLSQRSSAPIVPAYISGAYDVWNKSRRFPKLSGKISCRFGKPIYPSDFEGFSKKEAQEKIALSIESAIAELRNQTL